ncbi:nuclear transport factor 2 family protein [Streptomyces sp. NPDC101118]|uniref:nuclear transport factor 2 family protein n=1 Tax=Streptomyces sp. NPDC101118 TaxID=3366109 RepID=UPI0038259CA8
MTHVTRQRVEAAYRALGTGDRARILEYYSEDLRWLVPGNHPLAGWYESLDAFLELMGRTHRLTDGTFRMDIEYVLTGPDVSADVCRNTGLRAGAKEDAKSPYERMDYQVFHFMRWRDGRIVEGRDGLFGDTASAFSSFWAPFAPDGIRRDR